MKYSFVLQNGDIDVQAKMIDLDMLVYLAKIDDKDGSQELVTYDKE